MALFDIKETKSLYTELGNKMDSCFYCIKAVKQKNTDGLITYEDMLKEIKALRGKLTIKRIAKMNIAGNNVCICEECLSQINSELGNSITNIFENVNILNSDTDDINKVDDFGIPEVEVKTLENKVTLTKKKSKK